MKEQNNTMKEQKDYKIDYKKAVENIREQLKQYVKENKLKSLVLGVSGGIDSCLCAALAKPVCDELNIPLIGRSLPILSNKQDEIDRAKRTGECFCTNFNVGVLSEIFNQFAIINPDPTETYISFIENQALDNEKIKKDWKIRNGNIKARLRMIYLYNLASMTNGMVLSTDNYTEYLLGFWTLHGDVADYAMIQNLWKTEVYDIAEWIARNECKTLEESTILLKTIDALATDGLGVTDMGDLGQIMPDFKGTSRDGYKEVDQILKNYLLLKNEAAMTPKVITVIDKIINHPVIQRHNATHFKRNNPVNILRSDIFKIN
ncbi:MAG: NAD(+) synthase [Clostridia bacterium]